MAKKKTEPIKQELEYQKWVDIYFNYGFNGRATSKQVKPHLTMESAEVDAARMLGNARVQELIEEKQIQTRIRENIDLGFIVSQLKGIVFECAEEGIERDPDSGRITSKPDRKSQIAALTLLSKIGGFETKKLDINIEGNLNQIIWKEEKTYGDDNKKENE